MWLLGSFIILSLGAMDQSAYIREYAKKVPVYYKALTLPISRCDRMRIEKDCIAIQQNKSITVHDLNDITSYKSSHNFTQEIADFKIYPEPKTLLVLLHDGKAYCAQLKNNQIQEFFVSEKSFSTLFSYNLVHRILMFAEDHHFGVWYIDTISKKSCNNLSSQIRCAEIKDENTFWTGTADGGLYQIFLNTNKQKKIGTHEYPIFQLYYDKESQQLLSLSHNKLKIWLDNNLIHTLECDGTFINFYPTSEHIIVLCKENNIKYLHAREKKSFEGKVVDARTIDVEDENSSNLWALSTLLLARSEVISALDGKTLSCLPLIKKRKGAALELMCNYINPYNSEFPEIAVYDQGRVKIYKPLETERLATLAQAYDVIETIDKSENKLEILKTLARNDKIKELPKQAHAYIMTRIIEKLAHL